MEKILFQDSPSWLFHLFQQHLDFSVAPLLCVSLTAVLRMNALGFCSIFLLDPAPE